MGNLVRRPEQRAHRLVRWYPASWRATHAEEFAALLEDSMTEHPFWPRRGLDIAIQVLRLRSLPLRDRLTTRRGELLGGAVAMVIAVAALAAATSGFGLIAQSAPSKGGFLPSASDDALPTVIARVPPTAVGRFSGMDVDVEVRYVRARGAPPGQVASVSPPVGSTVHVEQAAIVGN